jgi:hypothetical protein
MTRKPIFSLPLAAAAVLLLCCQARPAAHDIPTDVTVRTFVKPEGQRLRLLVRVPIVALRDIVWPLRAPDTLDIGRAQKDLRDAASLWVADAVRMYEGDTALPYPTLAQFRAAPGGDRSFETYDQAVARVTAPFSENEDIVVQTGSLDILFEFPIRSEHSRFSIDPKWARLGVRTITVVRLLLPGGAVRAFELEGNPGLVRLDPEWYQAAWRFVKLGFEHILDGTDHLLFLFCLVIPFRRFRQLLVVITSFTVAHSVTLIASAYNIAPDALWFPPLIETLIATSIVYMALENIVGANLHRRWLITFGFGLVHGFGFSFALRQTLQFAGSHLLTSLLSFNLGVELGQLLVLAVLIPLLDTLFKYVVVERMGTIILSAIVAHTGWHWMTDRARVLSQYRFEMPDLTPALMVGVLRVLMVVVAVAGAAWLLNLLKSRRPGAATRVRAELTPPDQAS